MADESHPDTSGAAAPHDVPGDAKEGHGAKKAEEKPSILEAKANDMKYYAKGAAAAGLTALTWTLGNPYYALAPLSQQFTGLSKADVTPDQFLSRTLMGIAQIPGISYVAAKSIELAPRVASMFSPTLDTSLAAMGVSFAAMPLMAGAYSLIGYPLFNNYSFKGFGEYFKKKFPAAALDTTVWYGTPVAFATAFAPHLLFPAAALGNILYGFVSGYRNQPEKDRKSLPVYTWNYGKNTVNNAKAPLEGAASSIRRYYNEVFQPLGASVYKFFTSIVDSISSAAPATAEAKPATAPAAAH